MEVVSLCFGRSSSAKRNHPLSPAQLSLLVFSTVVVILVLVGVFILILLPLATRSALRGDICLLLARTLNVNDGRHFKVIGTGVTIRLHDIVLVQAHSLKLDNI